MGLVEDKHRRDIFGLILFFASSEGLEPLPNSEDYLLLELATAVVDYLGGDGGQIPEPYHVSLIEGWTHRVNRVIGEVLNPLNPNSKKLNLVIAQVLRELLNIEWKSDHGENWWDSGIRWQLEYYPDRGIGWSFHLTVPKAKDARDCIEKYIDPDTVEHCRQIGALMKKYIVRDFAARASRGA